MNGLMTFITFFCEKFYTGCVFTLYFQTKLHDGICVKRQAATIATHDFDLVKSPLTYDAQVPQELKVRIIFFV